MNPVTFNRDLDQQLTRSGAVDSGLFAKLMDAYTYDAASTVGWVQAKLAVLQKRLETGATLLLHEPAQGQAVAVSSHAHFLLWIRKHFPVAEPKQ